ncbi:MAG: mercuric transporter MerT family protein [Pseudomonadota bacterium]
MTEAKTISQTQSGSEPRGTGLLATGGIVAAIGAASCCVLPLALTLLGVSGAWMANLRALSPYQPYFIGLAAVAIGYGFYQVYWRQPACEDGDACARPLPNWLVKSGLWSGAAIIAISATFPIWFPAVIPYLP